MTEAERRALFERSVADGRRVAERLARDPDVLGVWLSGPFTAPRVDPASDLHLGVLTASGNDRSDPHGASTGGLGGRSDRGRLPVGTGGGRLYHHQLPAFSEVGRRLEIAFLPLVFFEETIARGIERWNDLFDCDKLSDVVILCERDGAVSACRERLGALRPAHMFVGAQIGMLRGEWDAVERLLGAGRRGESILRARALASLALKIFLCVARGLIFSKSSQLRAMLAGNGPPSLLRTYDECCGTARVGAGEAERIVRRCSDIVRTLYERKGVCAADSG